MIEIYPWQHEEIQRLLLMHQQDRIPHALLFSGPDGIGLKRFALVFVMRLLCLSNNSQLETACGICKSCELFKAESHPDLYFIEPEEKGKMIKIEQIRKLIEYASNKSFSGDVKIVLIESADAMNRFTSPALLKTLEEPPEQTKIILLSHNSSRLPITIRSRCQRIDFKPVYGETAISWLSEKIEHSEITPEILLRLSGGAPLKAIELATDEQQLACRDKLIKNLSLLDNNNSDPVKIAEYWFEMGPDNAVSWLLRLINDLIRLKLSPKKADIINIDLREDLQGLSNRLDLPRLIRGYEFISLKYRELGGPMNYSPRSILEEIALFWKNLTVHH
tara:strand:- start:24 stop:1025 length:1002 start_codon:yes stop_codon:yes gene_type:complete